MKSPKLNNVDEGIADVIKTLSEKHSRETDEHDKIRLEICIDLLMGCRRDVQEVNFKISQFTSNL